MSTNGNLPSNTIARDFTVAVFVTHRDRVLMHHHAKLDRWLPPGGHIEPNELPDEAATREVWEETGVNVTLVGDPVIEVGGVGLPRQLIRPVGIQLEAIGAGHEHIDLIYFATGEPVEPRDGVVWATAEDLSRLDLTAEVAAWCMAALTAARTQG